MIFPTAWKKFGVGLLKCGVLGLILLFSVSVRAQVTGATLSGTVTDASGAIVPQAQISIKNVATGVNTTVSTDAAGFYSAPNLLPGNYEISASAAGFSTEVRSGVTLTVGTQQVLNFALRVGQVTQTVQVTGEAPVVELASSSISAVVSANTVVQLPLNGRDWTQLATLQPAVHAVTTQVGNSVSGNRAARGNGNALTISGTRPQLNNYRLDGISLVDYVGGGPGSALGTALGVDAIAEFSVMTSNFSAEYGKTSGGVINAITRSGTNQLRGDAYWFLRDEGFDAADFFDNAAGKTIPPFHRNQFGGSVGGPIQKDKTFFFFDYEGFRQQQTSTSPINVPSQDARNGIIHNSNGTTCTIGVASPGCALTNSAGTVGVDPLVQPFLGFWPLPTQLVGLGNTGIFNVPIDTNDHENFETVRMDRKFSEKDSIFGTYFYDSALSNTPEPLGSWLIGNGSGRQMIVLEETHVFSPSLVNSLRGGYSRVTSNATFGISAIKPIASDLSLGSIQGRPAGTLKVPGLTTSGGGLGATTNNNHWFNSYQLYDDAFLTKGVHSLKFGFAFERTQDNDYGPISPNGAWSFGSLTNLLINQPKTFETNLKSPEFGLRQSIFGGYLQDDWRWRSNLTLNLGIRYEPITSTAEVHNYLVNMPTYTSTPPGRLGGPIFKNPTLRNFEPRVGFAWDPFRNGKTAVRGAFGIFDALPLNFLFYHEITNVAPFTQVLAITHFAPDAFPKEVVSGLSSVTVPFSDLRLMSYEGSPPRNYVMTWNLNIQRQLSPSTTVAVGYAGNRGVHMSNRVDDGNVVLPTPTPQGLFWPSPAGSGTVLNPAIGDLRIMYWGGDSFYDALEVQVSKRMSHGFQVQGSYTWGKNIDTGSAASVGDPYTNSISSPPWFCIKSCWRGLADYDIAHVLVINYLWDVPAPKNWGAIGSHVLGGWSAGGIFTAQTGVPITPLIGGDPLGLNSNDPFAYPNRLTGPGCANPVSPGNVTNYIKLSCFAPPNPLTLFGNEGRNTVIGPGLMTWDFSLFKNNYFKRISENFNAQFRAEFFNILNRANFGPPVDNSTLFDQTGGPVDSAGALDSLSTSARQIQFALKLIW